MIVAEDSAIAATAAQIISASSTPIHFTKWSLVKALKPTLRIVIQRKVEVTAMSSKDLLSVDDIVRWLK